MARILDSEKSSGGSPYAYYTVDLTTSNRSLYAITANVTVYGRLASSSSSLGTGQSMGLNAYITLNGREYGPIELKSTSTSWSGTTSHSASGSFNVNNLSVLQSSISNIKFRVSRTGTAEGDYSKGASLSSTNCGNVSIPQAQAQSVFNSILSGATNETFSINATQYNLYDVLTIKNGDTVIKTIDGVVSGVAYSFSSEEQSTLNALFGANESTRDLTATLTTYTNSSKTTNLGSTSLTMPISIPAYIPTITLSSVTDTVTTYNAYKNNVTDLIKGISKPTIVVSMSNNYNNTYASAQCNGVSGTLSGRTATFTAINQADSYNITVTDSRGKTNTIVLTGDSYAANIKTVQYSSGSAIVDITRTTPTGTTADVEVVISVYDGTNLTSLLTENFSVKYTEQDGTEITINKNQFTYANNKYTYQITGLNYKKAISYSVIGTDKIGRAINGNTGSVSKGLAVWNAFTDSNNENNMRVNGNFYVTKLENENMISVSRSDTNKEIKFGIDSNGVNRGIYDETDSKWLLKNNGTSIQIDGQLFITSGEVLGFTYVGDVTVES